MAEGAPDVAVRFEHVWVHLEGEPVLQDIDLEVPAGAFLGVVGPNGAGKTTLLKTVLGLVRPTRGRVEVFGRPPGGDRGERTVGYVPQRQAIAPGFPATVADVVLMGRLAHRGGLALPRRADRREVERVLDLVNLRGLSGRFVGQLSGGEQRRVVLAQALSASTRLLVLDEPTVGLDLPAEQEFYALVRRLQHDLSLTVLIVSHDIVALAGEADRLLCINRRMHVHGNPEEVVHSHALRDAYACQFDFLAAELAHHRAHEAGEHAGHVHGAEGHRGSEG